MTRAEYKAHLVNILAADERVKITDLEDYVDKAITLGLNAFYGAHNWWFRLVEYTLTVTSAADSYNLPLDFDSFVTVREQSTTDGQKLQFYPKELFDEKFPKLSAFTSDYPQAFTVFQGENTDYPQIALMPRPTSATLKILYNRGSVNDPDSVPQKYQAGLAAAIAWQALPFGHPGRGIAYQEFRAEVERLRISNKVDESDISQMPDGTSDQVPSVSPYGWIR
jgi:hypothetical protein